MPIYTTSYRANPLSICGSLSGLKHDKGNQSSLASLRQQDRRHDNYCDGNGLYLQITAEGVKSWLFRYMGLGPLYATGLADARTRALECRRLLLDGIDPLDSKRNERAADLTAKARAMTFDECASAYIEARRGGWKNEKHGDQWKNTLATYAGPVFGALPVADVDTGLVMKVLEPIWYAKTETASRVRGRIRVCSGLGEGTRLSIRRKSGALARSSR
jgi:hypothetical protein